MNLIKGLVSASLAAIAIVSFAAKAEEREADLPHAIYKLFGDPSGSDSLQGVAGDDGGDQYHHSFSVVLTSGKEGDSVEKQVRTSAEAALRIGYLVLQEGYKPPGSDLIFNNVEGDGMRTKSENQPHALGYAPGENTEREGVPVPSDGERPLPDARGPVTGRT